MYAKVTCHPPLGQTTIVPAESESVTFTILIETDPSSERSWEVALWHNHRDTQQWESLSLVETNDNPGVLVLESPRHVKRRWFTTELVGPPQHTSTVSFTLNFRNGSDESWKWVNEQFSYSDGQLIYGTPTMKSRDFEDFIGGCSSEFKISDERAETPDTLLWSVTGSVKAAKGKDSGYSNSKFGVPQQFTKWFALIRLWSPWLAPRQGKGKFWPDKDTIIASFLRKDGYHVVVLAVSGIRDVMTVLRHDDDGNIIVNSRNDAEFEDDVNVLVAVSKDMEIANGAVMYHARKMVTRYSSSTSKVEKEMTALAGNDQKAKWLEEWYDGLSYCTWNGLGQHLTEEGIYKALDSLKSNNINITNLIIDDNWQSLDHEGGNQFQKGWMEFEANKQGFPNGLRQCVLNIRQKHKNLAHIAVWHALLGYWGGISADGKIAKEYKTLKVKKKDGVAGGEFLVVAEEDVSRFYADFYDFLSRSGIDSVKTDAQFFLDELAEADARRSLIRKYQDAWSIANLRNLSAKAISCMSQTPQLLFHSQLPINKPRLLVRNSDDFFPDVPASHPWHIFCNAHNSIFTQYLNVLPDWDMFQTSHPWASFHAAARCVSGGPIYITDVPGEHNINLINQMTALTPRGETVILRPHVVGKSITAYTGYDDLALLKVGTFCGRKYTGTGILGVFNCTQKPLSELIPLSDFPGTEVNPYVIRAHKSGETSKPMSRKDKHPLVSLDLPVQGWEILSTYAVLDFTLKRKENGNGDKKVRVANLGLVDKMTGAAAVVNTDMYVERTSGRLRVWTSLKALGTYGLYISDLENRSLEDDFMALIFGLPVPLSCVRKSSKSNDVLEIDIARAWKESNHRAGWSNEVVVEVMIR